MFILVGMGSSSAAFTIAAAGDISCPADATAKHAAMAGTSKLKAAVEKCQGRGVARMIRANEPDYVLALGDLIQGQRSDRSAYRDFGLAWGSLEDRLLSSIGNHDYHGNGKGNLTPSGYFEFWGDRKTPGWRIGGYGRGWNSFNRGKWHLINLNSNCIVVDCTLSGPQLRWLARDLRADRANRRTECTLAFFHHPLFSAGVREGRAGRHSRLANIWELLYRYRADLVLNGHQHHYERFRPQDPGGRPDQTGITQIISGTGGASLFPVKDERGRLAANSDGAFHGLGATFLRLGSGSYSSWFRGLDHKVRDRQAERDCLGDNAGPERRKPRTRLYEKRVRQMAALGHRAGRLVKKVRRLKNTRRVAPARYIKAKARRDAVIGRRARLRERRLYY